MNVFGESRDINSTGFDLRIAGSTGVLEARVGTVASGKVTVDTDPGAVTAGTWQHVALTFNGSTIKVYVNGSMLASEDLGTPTTIQYDGDVIRIGMMGQLFFGYWHWPFVGNIDEARIYNRALSATEIARLAAGTQPQTSSGSVTLAGALSLSGSLTLAAGTLDVSSSDYAVSASGSWLNYGGLLAAREGTVTLRGNGAGMQILSGGQSFYDLTLAGSGNWSAGDALDIDHDLTVGATLTAPSSTLTLAGDFTNDGTFTHNSGTVTLDGTSQALNGSTAFYNLSKTVSSADTLTFAAGDTQTVAGALSLRGAAGALLSLRSDTPGSRWYIVPQPGYALEYLSVKDSQNLGAVVAECYLGCSDAGNNDNWRFPGSEASGTTGTSGGGGGGGGGSRRSSAPLPAQPSQSSSLPVSQPSPAPAEPSSSGETHALFSDVPPTSWFDPYVRALTTAGIVSGYKDARGRPTGEFRPANPVTRAELLKMALLGAGRTPGTGTPANRSARGDWSAPYVKLAEDRGLTLVTPSLIVTAPATRGEVARTVLEAFGLPISGGENPFTDLPPSHRHVEAMLTAYRLGILSGDTDAQGNPRGTVRPDDPVNRAEVAKMITLAREVAGK
jgi:hypothetical protein